jgi:hypothetical protein
VKQRAKFRITQIGLSGLQRPPSSLHVTPFANAFEGSFAFGATVGTGASLLFTGSIEGEGVSGKVIAVEVMTGALA